MEFEKISLNELIGKTFYEIKKRGDNISFTDMEGTVYKFNSYHSGFSETFLEDIEGELSDLANSKIIIAEMVKKTENYNSDLKRASPYYDYSQWVFYKFATLKGYVTIKWRCEASANYSSEVIIEKIKYF